MKCQKLKTAMLAAAIAAAGFSYSCSRQAAPLQTEWERQADAPAKQESGDAAASPAPIDEEPDDLPRTSCYVHICGEVVSPGVYELEAGDRVYQAVEKAGGFTGGAATEYLNLAGEVRDGMKLVVPKLEDLDSPERYGVESGGNVPEVQGLPQDSSSGTRININTASKERLMNLNGIGSARAEAIIRYREDSGGFKKIEDIMKVSGIKDASFQKIKDDITV